MIKKHTHPCLPEHYRFFQIYIHIKNIVKRIRDGHKERGAGVGFNKDEET